MPLTRALQALDPRQVIGRGYALVRDERGQLVTDAAQLLAGQALQLDLPQARTITVGAAIPPRPATRTSAAAHNRLRRSSNSPVSAR